MDELRIINSKDINDQSLEDLIPQYNIQFKKIEYDVKKIIEDIKNEGDNALIRYTKKFDSIDLNKNEIKIKDSEIKEAYNQVDKDLLEALRFSKKNLIKFHSTQLKNEWSINILEGVSAGQIYRPIESIGIYVPGGKAIYPSTVLMAAVPAYVAGVKKISICSPPQSDSNIAPEIIVAANEFNITNIYKVGGVQAIAAMAYGTETISAVQKVVGPGNKWVNTAKQLLSKIIAIDNPAGPSDILIIADKSANHNYVIADLISQIEHDTDNIGIIVSESDELIKKITDNINFFVEKAERKEIIKKALKNCFIVKAESLEDCVRISNLIAPEHLEIITKYPRELLLNINNAGAVFLGPYSPVPLGDYSAGTNHILPTGGYAKTYSGLSTYDFIKIMDVLECTEQGLSNLSKSTMTLAKFEKFYSHREAIAMRLKDKK
ncbi:MAG: histidinol dehydrogenase [Candidatus Lokiarchaeota archaeon]|nr:histidinol dehydrogenase [Candidatus Lokiarchaeota archaeon]